MLILAKYSVYGNAQPERVLQQEYTTEGDVQ